MGNVSGRKILVEQCPKIELTEILSEARKRLIPAMMEHLAYVDGFPVEFTTSELSHGGRRMWFKCSFCGSRSGVLYKHPLDGRVGCRNCLQLEYRSRRYKGMLENDI